MRKSFILHLDSLSVLDELTDEQAGKLLKACYAFNTGNELELDQLLKIVFTPFKNQFSRDAEKYKKTCENRALAGSKGGKQRAANQASASNDKQTLANQADSDSKNDSVSDSKNKSNSDKDRVDYSCLRMSDDDVLEAIRIRKKNAKTAKQGILTQRIVNKLAVQFEEARKIGWSNSDILDEWEIRGWLSFEASWLKQKQESRDIPEQDRPNLDKAFELIFQDWHNSNGKVEAMQTFKNRFANYTRSELISEMEHMDAYKDFALDKIKSGDGGFMGFDNMKFSTFIDKSRWLDMTKEELGL